jgi:hypothetical protein
MLFCLFDVRFRTNKGHETVIKQKVFTSAFDPKRTSAGRDPHSAGTAPVPANYEAVQASGIKAALSASRGNIQRGELNLVCALKPELSHLDVRYAHVRVGRFARPFEIVLRPIPIFGRRRHASHPDAILFRTKGRVYAHPT